MKKSLRRDYPTVNRWSKEHFARSLMPLATSKRFLTRHLEFFKTPQNQKRDLFKPSYQWESLKKMTKKAPEYIKCPFCEAKVLGIGEHIQRNHKKIFFNWLNDEENKKLQKKMQQMQSMVHSNNAQ